MSQGMISWTDYTMAW